MGSGRLSKSSKRRKSNREPDLHGQSQGNPVIGHLAELDDIDRKTTFQLFRRNLINPEIITFDELYERAKFITENPAEGDRGQNANRPTVLPSAETDLPELRQFIKSNAPRSSVSWSKGRYLG